MLQCNRATLRRTDKPLRTAKVPCPGSVAGHRQAGALAFSRAQRALGQLPGEAIVVGIDSIIVMIVVGAIAGWLAGQIMRGFGFGLIWNIIIGIIGAFIGVWLLTTLRIVPFAGFLGSIINATIGAVIVLLIVGLIRRR
jgi:uncharacterized membrane protein YeaQ/YmgE (transglycosylase-associated protein family)